MQKSNRFTFGLGTIGRDMLYSLISMYLIFYLTDVLVLPDRDMWWIAGIILVVRIFDALYDPIMGVIVDNTHTKFGKFKPWISIGAIVSGAFTILIFSGIDFTGSHILLFAVIYLLWGMSFTANDIAYWSMLPSLTLDLKEREKIGSIARISANVGMFFVVAGIVPITEMLGERFGSLQKGYFAFSVIVVIIMIIGQCITVFGVREPKVVVQNKSHTSLKDMVRIIFKNDQLFYTAICMALFMIGYMTTTSFGLYFFKYAYGNVDMYTTFAIILGISQISALVIFPMLRKKFERKTLYTTAILMVFSGYIIFFFAPTNTMLFIGASGILMFVGQAFIQLLMLMFLADTVDYGHWKFGKRNDSVTFSIQPFINKMGGAVASGVVSYVVIVSGIKNAESAADVTEGGLLMMKTAMLIFPLICIVASYLIYRAKYRLDGAMHKQILEDLHSRGELTSSE